jgi:Putative beta barrel porin-7 (BBP7)
MRSRALVAGIVGLLLAPSVWAQMFPTAPPARVPEEDGTVKPRIIRAEPAPEIKPTPQMLPAVYNATATSPVLSPQDVQPAAPVGSRFWMSNEVLMWWIQPARLPTLVTTSPAGTPLEKAGVLGQNDTNVLFGGGEVNSNLRWGWRFQAGTWLDEEHRLAIEANVFVLESGATSFAAGSTGDPILARPVINPAIDTQTAIPIAFPGVVSGSISVFAQTGSLVGTGIWLREIVCCSDDQCNTCRHCVGGGCGGHGCNSGGCADGADHCHWCFSSILGYRFLRLNDRLAIGTDVTTVGAFDGLPPGTRILTGDQFSTLNSFHGVDLGAMAEIRRGNLSVELLGKVAVGYNEASVTIDGFTNTPAGGTTVGGLLTQTTNINHTGRTSPTAVPELGIKLGYQVRPNMRVYAGYTLLYWYHVLRAADQVDLSVDPNFLPGQRAALANPMRPAFNFQDTDIWVQGLSLGFEWRY